MFFRNKPTTIPTAAEALPGRASEMPVTAPTARSSMIVARTPISDRETTRPGSTTATTQYSA